MAATADTERIRFQRFPIPHSRFPALNPQPAYVLHARAYRETSLLLELLTLDNGRIGAIARGVRSARGQPLRAALQPLQPLQVSLRGRGELPLLVGAEVQGSAAVLVGDALLAAFYLNELLVRLLPRSDPMPVLFWRYAECLGELGGGAPLGWTLRRFERDLLQALGYALQLELEADGETPLDADGWYRYHPQQGAVPARAGGSAVPGAALLALGADEMPPPELQLPLRRLLRGLLAEHLGGRELRSWGLLTELGGR
jgi:DNA repair protein RecO (recombination protein O)